MYMVCSGMLLKLFVGVNLLPRHDSVDLTAAMVKFEEQSLCTKFHVIFIYLVVV